MSREFAAVVQVDGEWVVAHAPEVPGANGQGRTRAEALESLSEAITLILADRLADALDDLPAGAETTVVSAASADTSRPPGNHVMSIRLGRSGQCASAFSRSGSSSVTCP